MRYISILPRSAVAPIHHALQFRYALTAHAWRGLGVVCDFLDIHRIHRR
jgi:hypothetical protein